MLILYSMLDVLDRNKVMECSSGGGSNSGHYNQDHYHHNCGHARTTEGSGEFSSSSSKWRFGTRGDINGGGDTGFRWRDEDVHNWLAMSAAALRSAMDRGMTALKRTFTKVKAAAEETAYAAARPRHW